MGRPDLTEQRTTEILDAMQWCVANYGLDGSTLQRVAERAGMQRSILRHYVGNRDELVLALADRVISEYRQDFQGLLDSLTESNRIEQLLKFFFPPTSRSTAESILVIESLIAASDKYPQIGQQILEYVQWLVDQTAEQFHRAYPSASLDRCWTIAYAVVSICFNQDSLTPLDLPPKYLKAARASSRLLIASLQSESNA